MRKGEALFLQGAMLRLCQEEIETIYIQRTESSALQAAGLRVTVGVRREGETRERTAQFFASYAVLQVEEKPGSHGWRLAFQALQRLGLA